MAMWAILRQYRFYRYLLLARVLSSLGDWFTYMLMVVLTYERTGRADDAMTVVAAQAVATLVFSYYAGPFVDRRPPPRVMATMDGVRCLLVAGLAAIPVHPLVYDGVAFATAGAAAFFNPAQGRWVMSALSADHYGSAQALRQTLDEAVKIVGPGLAVTVLAILGRSHELIGFAIDAGSFAMSLALIIVAAGRDLGHARGGDPAQPAAHEPPWRDWRAITPTLVRPAVRTTLIVLIMVVLAFGGADVVLLAFMRTSLHLPSLDVGYLVTALSIGIIIGTVGGQNLAGRLPPRLWLGMALAGLGGFFGGAAMTGGLWACMAALTTAGLFNGTVNVNLATYLMRMIPSEQAGRFFALTGTLTSLAQITGMAVNSVLIAGVGPRVTLMIVGGWVLSAGLYGAATLAEPGRPAGADPATAVQ
jgi:DHA3 family macrolide efflux protein-like MFS transporter